MTEEIKQKKKNKKTNKQKHLDTNENESTIIQNVQDSAKTVLRGKSIVTQSYLRKEKKNHKPKKT